MLETVGSGGAARSEASPKPDRVFTMLENNPDVMNELAHRLGVTKELSFYDVYSLDDPDMMAMVPRPVFALLTTIPISEAWKQDRDAEDGGREWYKGAGSHEPAIWFRQTIINGCGLIGLLHCVSNGTPADLIVPGSKLADFLEKANPLGMDERAKLLSESDSMYEDSEAVAYKGDTHPLNPGEGSIHHFVALVKGRDGNLWELEGDRKGPLNRGSLADDEDAFSERALELGIKRLIEIQRKSGVDLPFSCIALAPSLE
ncbi:ubiquitin carboxyl-terminal hydrolase isozyme L4 [Lophiotrema nucula]|uniref:Ubiquitin carboxyl-terminal hydrolase n=1 Tax=Lophiotrema nucula TaxID=690887 RepID=A0A6A5Z927_9PLEO|nr:ubiquitin carboxyl-terminal hydrolase isozyme L4 [Lophiotrema nucula]